MIQEKKVKGCNKQTTESKQAEIEPSILSMAIEQSINIVFITDFNGVIEYVNPMFEEVTGYSKEDAIGQTPRILASGETSKTQYEELWRTITAGKTWRYLFKNKKKDGEHYWANSIISPITNEQGKITHFLSIQEDVTEKIRSKERIQYLASHDEITGLINRSRFMELLNEWVHYALAYGHKGVLLLVNIDQFRFINDAFGHLVGDDALFRIAELLQNTVSDIDVPYIKKAVGKKSIIGRLGGDEFAVFLPYRDKKEGMAVAERLRKEIEELRLVDVSNRLTTSIGVVLFPRDGTTTKDLFTKVDASMYRAKELGRNRSHLYHPEDRELEQTHSRLKWKERILKALEEDRFESWFQPILDLRDNKIHHYEALTRMRDEDGDILLPGAFIDVAERFGIIGSIDRVVAEKTMRLQAEMSRHRRSLSFGINLSGKDLGDKEFLTFLQSKILETGADPNHLIFEITETAAIHNLERAIKFIKALRSMGCHFALDDFGVGFTSFVYLREMQVDYIKIDGSFISNLHEHPNDQLIVKAITDVAKGMRIKTIAEFVEKEETIRLLKEYGVDYAQGYLIGRPAPDLK